MADYYIEGVSAWAGDRILKRGVVSDSGELLQDMPSVADRGWGRCGD